MTTQWQNALPHPIAFVLSGGAALGAIQVGMLQALTAVHLHPDIVVGTSAGSLNGAVIAEQGLPVATDTLTRLWHNFTREDFFPGGWVSQVKQLMATRNSLFPNNRLAALISQVSHVTCIEEMPIPFGALATALDTFHGVLFTAGNLQLALMASAAIPGIYPPVEIQNRLFVDGALTAHVPLKAALLMGAKSLVVLDAGEICHQKRTPRHSAELLLATMHVAMRQRVRVEAPAIAQQVPVLYLPTPCPISTAVLDFSESRQLIDQARQMAADFLADAPVPVPGKMSGAPHFHNHEPVIQLMQIASA